MAQMAQTAQTIQTARVPKNFRTVITAAAGGNVIEWYDFYIFGSLAAILSVKFFEKSHPVAALLSTIALFTAGFLVRPLGAFVFGWLGDRRRPQIYVPHDARRHGSGHRGDRLDPDLRPDRLGRRDHPVLFADDPGPLPGRPIRRRHHLCRRARGGRTPRLLYRLAADLADAWHRAVAHRDHRDTHLLRRGRVQCLGVAHPVLVLLPAGVHRLLHASPVSRSCRSTRRSRPRGRPARTHGARPSSTPPI